MLYRIRFYTQLLWLEFCVELFVTLYSTFDAWISNNVTQLQYFWNTFHTCWKFLQSTSLIQTINRSFFRSFHRSSLWNKYQQWYGKFCAICWCASKRWYVWRSVWTILMSTITQWMFLFVWYIILSVKLIVKCSIYFCYIWNTTKLQNI